MSMLSMDKFANNGTAKRAKSQYGTVIPAKEEIREMRHVIDSVPPFPAACPGGNRGPNDAFDCPVHDKGFTLIEVIITLVVAAILGTILVQFMGTSLTRSAEPIVMVQEGFSLSEIMEKMTAHYKYLLATDSAPLTSFKQDIENGNDDKKTPYFGDYSIKTDYITFSSGNEAPDTSGNNRILKVTIDKGDQSLVTLFTK